MTAPSDHEYDAHRERELQTASPALRRTLAIAAGVLLALTALAVARLWPYGYSPPPPKDELASTENVDATVSAVQSKGCGGGTACLAITVHIDSGPDAGQTTHLPDMQPSSATGPLRLADKLVLSRVTLKQTGQVTYNLADYQRGRPLWILGLAFAVLVVLVARWRGLAALAGLAITWFVLVLFLIPGLLNGENATAVALTSAVLITFVVLYIAHGVSARTTIALFGTIASLLLTGILAVLFTSLTRLTGLVAEEVAYIGSQGATVDAHGLLLAGIVIGTLGVLTDITVTQSAIVWEIHAANPTQTIGRLYRSGMRTGRDHIASTVYTLVLAYAGATLPLLILFIVGGQPFGTVLTSEVVAEELVRTLLGSIGLIASVPLTTFLAALVVHRSTSTHNITATTPPNPTANLDGLSAEP